VKINRIKAKKAGMFKTSTKIIVVMIGETKWRHHRPLYLTGKGKATRKLQCC
jgi:hypothetical protein